METGKRLKPSIFKRLSNYFSKSGMFSRALVLFCIFYCVRLCEWSMDQFEQSNMEASTLLTAALTLFGGELLLLCLKRVFAKKDQQSGAKQKNVNEAD